MTVRRLIRLNLHASRFDLSVTDEDRAGVLTLAGLPDR